MIGLDETGINNAKQYDTVDYRDAYAGSITLALDALKNPNILEDKIDLDTGLKFGEPRYTGDEKCEKFGKLKDCPPVKKPIRAGDFPPDDTVSVSDYDGTNEAASLDSLYRLAPKKGKKWMLWLKGAQDANTQYNSLPTDASIDLVQEKLDKISTLVSQLNDPLNWREFSENNPQLFGEIEETPDIAVLENGYFEEMVNLINKEHEPVRTVGLDFSPTIVEHQPVLIIPSGGLYGLEKSEIIRASLDEYVKQGGTLIVFSQQYGYEFSILPVPQEVDGSYKQVGGYGWAEDQSCFYSAAYIEMWHEMLAGLRKGIPDIHIDGYLMHYPSNATILLRRTANGQPALLLYEHGQGRVIVTSMYSDVALRQNQASSEEIGLIRDIISWAKAPEQLPEVKPGQSVPVSVTVKNTTNSDASSAKILIYDPDRTTLVLQETVSVAIPAGQSAAVPVSFMTASTSALGIYHIDYAIYDSFGNMIQPQSETDSGRIAVSNPPKNPLQTRQLNFSVQSDSEDFVWGSPVTFTINAFNNSDMERTVTAKIYDQSQTMIIPAKGFSSFVYVKTAACERGSWGDGRAAFGGLRVTFYEDGKCLSTCSKYYRVYFPSADVTVKLDKDAYAKGETLAINSIIKNRISTGWQPTLKITVWDSKGLIYEESKALLLPASGTGSVSTNYTLPTAAGVGSYHVGAGLYVPKVLGGFDFCVSSGIARFELPQSQVSIMPNLPFAFSMGSNMIPITITNSGRINVNSGILDLSLKASDGSTVYSGSQAFSIAVGETKTLDIPISIPSLNFGDYTLTYAQSDETKTGNPTKITVQNLVEITNLSVDKSSYKPGETSNLALEIMNTGKFNLENIALTVSAPDLQYTESQTILSGVGNSTSLNFSIPIPQAVSAGRHKVNVALTFPGGDSVAQSTGIFVPESSLSVRYQGPTVVSAGNLIEMILENTGAFDTTYSSTFSLYDKTGWDIDIKTGAGSIPAGGQTLLSYTLPDQLTDGGYQIGMGVTDTRTGKTIYHSSPLLNISGLKGNLSTKTDKDIYFSNEETTTLSTIINQQKLMVDGNLHLEIVCAEAASSSPPELQSFHVYTMDDQWQWTEQGVLHFPPYLYRQELVLPILVGESGDANVRMKHEAAEIAFVDYIALKDSNGNLYSPYWVAANERNITSKVQAEDDASAQVTGKYIDAGWIDLPSGVSYALVMRAWEGNACGIVWESDTTINQGSGITQNLNIPAGNLGYPGKFYLRGELTNSLGQTLGTSCYPFYIVDGDTVLRFNTDKRIYKPGETVTITGKIENRAPIMAENLVLTLYSARVGQSPQALLTETINLLSGGSYPFMITTIAEAEEGVINLGGTVTQNGQTLITISDQYEVANPLISTYIDMPETAKNEPFIIEVDIYNDGKVDAIVQFGAQSSEVSDSQTITIPASQMKIFQYTQQISKDVAYTFTFAGDYQETTTKTVTYGLGASIQIKDGSSALGVFPEGSVAIPVTITNTGQLDENLVVAYQLTSQNSQPITTTKAYYLATESNTSDTVYFNLTEGDYQITATNQRPDAFSQASFSVRKENQVQMAASLGTQTDGLIPINVNLANGGFNEINGSISLTLSTSSGQMVWGGGETLSQLSPQNSQLLTLNINPAAIDPGNYTVQVTLLNSSNQPISTQSLALGVLAPTFQVTQLPPYQTFNPGQEATFTFRVKNTGGQEGSYDLRLKAYDLIDSTQKGWLKPNEEETVTFGFMLPEDLEEKDYFADYELKASTVSEVSKGQIKYHLAGINLSVNATLDKPYYTEGETAHLTINIQSPNSNPQNLFARANYAGYEPQQTFTLSGNQVLIFDIPLPKITGEKLFYGIYHESGRSIHLNSVYIHKAGNVITVTTNKQVYNPGEVVSVSASGNTSGNLILSGPGGYEETFPFSGQVSRNFNLPATAAAGTYFISYQLSTATGESYTGTYPFDVAGIQVKVLECNNDKGKYASSDNITTGFTISSNTNMPALLKVWIVDPTGQYTSVGEQNITLSSSESSLITYNSPLNTSVSGIHRLVYGIYGPEDLLLCSGSEAFDVGDAVLMGISTDKRDYPTNTEPVTATASLFGSIGADLQLELDGALAKSEPISLNGFTTYTAQLQNITPGPHSLKVTLTAGGLKSTKEASFTYALAYMPKPQISASPGYLDFGNLNLGNTSTKSLTLSSTGNVDLVVGTIVLSGTDQGEFNLQNNNCSGRTIAPSGNCTLDVLFSPTCLGSKSASLSISSNAVDTPMLNLSLGGGGATALNLSINPEGGGRVTGTGIDCPGDCTESFSASGSAIQLIAAPNEGYTFTSWTGDINATENPMIVNMDINKNVTANFIINTYTITATAGLGGTISPAGLVTLNSGASQTFFITPIPGYNLLSVIVDGAPAGAIQVYTFSHVTANRTIEASFAINQYIIIANAGSNGTISPSGTMIMNYGASQTFTIAPNAGYHVADVRVDGVSVGAVTTVPFDSVTSNHTIEATFEIDNQPPVADAGLDQNVITSQVVILNGSKSFDPEAGMIAFLWSFVEVPAGSSVTNASLSDATGAKPQFTPDVNGAYRLQLIVNDGALNSVADEVVINAATPNVPPNANAGPDQNVVTGNTVQLDGSRSSDPDNGPLSLSYLWSFLTRPAGSLLSDNHIANRSMPNATFIPDVNGLYELRLTVSDGYLSSEDTVQIMATLPNVPPNANAGADITINLGDTAVLNGSASSDPDHGPRPLSYLWTFVAVPTGSQLTNGAISGAETASASFKPDVAGTYVLQLMAYDGIDAGFDNVAVTVGAKRLATLAPVKVWLGLKNSDDTGTYFDLRVDLLKNGVTIATGETRDIRGITRNPCQAKEASVIFGSISDHRLNSGDVLSLRILTKVTKTQGHSNATGLRLYYDGKSTPSRFGMEIAPDPLKDFFLHSNGGRYFMDNTFPTAKDEKYKDSPSLNRTTYKEIGTWSFTVR
ncbi:MAG TPA: PKD domain-containing protein [Thermodesulfobacteriota bacterium]|nr:PKD domain-containing protein [Thermodesulfobacteriota bacterium]